MARSPEHSNLPAEPNAFVGRESDVDELAHLMRVSRVVTLCGAGGIGKTRLALRLAARIACACPDGVWLVELAETDRDAAVRSAVRARVAAALGIVGELAETIGDRRVLLVLDNCEPVVAECADLCRDLLSACPSVSVLATSCEPLRVPGETVWRVPPLSVDGVGSEAVRLFVTRAAAARPGFALTDATGPQVVELCRVLDGLPLAIELAAAMVRFLSVGQLVERLDDRLRLLRCGPRTAPARHRTLWAAVDWSYRDAGQCSGLQAGGKARAGGPSGPSVP